MSNGVRVAPSTIGHGVFATRRFRIGEAILRIRGTPVTFDEAHADAHQAFNMLQVAPRLYLALESPALFINHSCDPNAGIQDDLVVIALREIAIGEEIRYDYSTTMSADHQTLRCECRAAACRTIVGNFEQLPSAVQARYRDLRVLQSFIAGVSTGATAAAPARAVLCPDS
jgi:uncharacterized protein